MASQRKKSNAAKPTRNGCRTCRIRKVKCDQGRPACYRCVSTGRTCDGEIGNAIIPVARERQIEPHHDDASRSLAAIPARPHVQTYRTRVTTTSISASPILSSNISSWAGLGSDLSDYERHGFRHFQVLTAPAMQTMLPSSDWIPVALQMSLQYPATFHAITATGTMARALTVLIHPTFPRPILHELASEAVRQYGKAIKLLRQHVDRAVSASTAIEPILVACLLCVCFESFRGRKSAAIFHARLGWEILQDKSTNMDTKRSPSVSFFNAIFPQHAGAHALFDDKEHHDSDCCMEFLSLPSRTFGSVEEATGHLATVAKHSEHFRMELLQLAKATVVQITQFYGLNDELSFCLATCLSRTIKISNLHRSRFERLKSAHVRWRSAYTPHEERFAEEDSEGNLVLRIKYLYSMFALATCRDSEELLSDRFMDDFRDALDFVEQYLAVVYRRSSVVQTSSTHEEPQQSMFFGYSILPTLHLIAHKCRDSTLRRRALHLLFTTQKQEGLEYSGALGMYATSAMEIEELKGFLLAQQSTGWNGQSLQPILPEQARIADCVVTGQGARGIYKLTCARYVHERSGPQQIELTQYEGGAMPLRLAASWMLAV